MNKEFLQKLFKEQDELGQKYKEAKAMETFLNRYPNRVTAENVEKVNPQPYEQQMLMNINSPNVGVDKQTLLEILKYYRGY